jgi:CRP-like cAMP-binding protein
LHLFKIQSVDRGQALFREGQPVEKTFLVQEGEVHLYKNMHKLGGDAKNPFSEILASNLKHNHRPNHNLNASSQTLVRHGLRKTFVDQKFLQESKHHIGIVGPKSFLAEESLIFGGQSEKYNCTAIAHTSPTTYY